MGSNAIAKRVAQPLDLQCDGEVEMGMHASGLQNQLQKCSALFFSFLVRLQKSFDLVVEQSSIC